jgi:hypothetical protein
MTDVFHFTEQGNHRVNEDAFSVGSHPEDARWTMCFLADGQGGQVGGARAARLACESAMTSCLKRSPPSLGVVSTWLSLLAEVDREVTRDPEAGFTTLIAFCLTPTHLLGASHGDSALWIANADGSVEDLTTHQIKNPPVGSGAAAFVPFARTLPRMWTTLAMSDGLWKYAGSAAIASAIRKYRGEQLLGQLRSRARMPSGHYQDDCTGVVLQSSQGSPAKG